MEQAVSGLTLDPDDGRHLGRPMSKPTFPSPFKPQPVLHLLEDPDGSVHRAMADSLNDMIHRTYLDYRDKVEAKAAELAAMGLGLEEVERATVADDDNPNVMRIRGTYRIVSLNPEGEPR